MEPQIKSDDQAIGFQLKQVNNMIRRKLDLCFAQAGLGELIGMQGPILGFIQKESAKRDVFQRDLEKHFNIRRSTATVMLQNLEQKGLIVREQTDADARLKKICLTESAFIYDKEIRCLLDQFNRELEAGISPAEKEQFFAVLEKIRHNLE